MGQLTEAEIFDCLASNLRLAAEHCEQLARLPARGPTYVKFRAELKLIEGACRQAAAWRDDTRWLPIGRQMARAHELAGEWLRRHHPRPLFLKLADNLRRLQLAAERLRDQVSGKATMTLGPILPQPLPGPHRAARPVQVKAPAGLILPPAAGALLLPR